MVNPIEMASPQEHVSEQLAAIPGYAAAFRSAFPGESAPVTLANAQKAIAVFEATLITPNAPFDQFLQGDESALTATEKQGLQLFMDKGCSVCHNGINLGGGMYAPFGVVENPGAELRESAWRAAHRRGNGHDCRVPRHSHGRAAEDRAPDSAAERRRDAAASAVGAGHRARLSVKAG
jgi:cytochrome c peroxidase